MGLTYQENFTIPFDMCDVKQIVKLPDLISYCLGLSGRQSEELGRSDLYVFQEFGLIWVVTDYELTIQALPKYNETITIKTEAVAYNKFFCHRMFYIYDEAGKLLMDILCYFVLIDFETRKLAPVPEDLIAPYQSEKVKKLPRALKYQLLEKPSVQEFPVRYFDLDMNGHVNNGKYLEWMYEALGYDFLLSHVPQKIQLKYLKEVGATSLVSSRMVAEAGVSQHEIVVDGHIHAQAVIEWRESHVAG
ncbi:acyl-[acyl-carrier-protein] thioesterase [Streptococcus suis]|uniref:acyl-ACP thioesterase domain-containing protein n=1 Tax=Streptococcus suis TaxID=1307 RepID=UPI001CF1B55E|nr:acyl-ACP thioesterase domain-containing protein [Streptococcus suis]MCB2892019.1 acyl-[acyl-carrier-protein] thioesterase [Streptococcus suis]